MKLNEYLKKQIESTYFAGIPERYILAREFIRLFDHEYCSKNGGGFASNVPFYNLDSLELQEISTADDAETKQFKVVFPNIKDDLNLNEQFTNYSFADCRSFKCNPFLGKERVSTNKDALTLYKKEEEYVITTLAIVLFHIYFGYHPLYGRNYYENLDVSSEVDRAFLEKKPEFIFKLENNTNRFVNGYQTFAWVLWCALSDKQKAFWNDVFAGAIVEYSDFYKRWADAYAGFVVSTVLTPCGVALNTVVFDENYALITSDNRVGKNVIRCKKCNNDLINECEICGVEDKRKKAALLKVKVEYVASDGGEKGEPLPEILCAGKILYAKGTSPTSKRAVFEVVASKKANLLGLRCLSDDPVEATRGSESKCYKKGEAIVLLPDVQIDVHKVMPGINKVVVPSSPASTTIAGV